MECHHSDGTWPVKKLPVKRWEGHTDPPDSEGGYPWRPFAVYNGDIYYRRFEPCRECREAVVRVDPLRVVPNRGGTAVSVAKR